MPFIESRSNPSTTPSATVSTVPHIFPSRATSTSTDPFPTAFKFPYDHDPNSEHEKTLKLLGEGYAPDIKSDPLEQDEVKYLVHRPEDS